MKKNNKKGFTLVELVIVVAVMAILVAVAIPTVKSVTESAKTSVQETNARTIESTIKLYLANKEAKTDGAPATLQKAMEEAALGIEKACFHYTESTGVAKYQATYPASAPTTADEGVIIIWYSDTGVVTVVGE